MNRVKVANCNKIVHIRNHFLSPLKDDKIFRHIHMFRRPRLEDEGWPWVNNKKQNKNLQLYGEKE